MKRKRETKAKLKAEIGSLRRQLAYLERAIEEAGTDRDTDDARYALRLEADALAARERLNQAAETLKMLGKALNIRMMNVQGSACTAGGMDDRALSDHFMRAAGQVAHAAYELESDDGRQRALRWFFETRQRDEEASTPREPSPSVENLGTT